MDDFIDVMSMSLLLMLNDGESEIRKTLCAYMKQVILKDKSAEKFVKQACFTVLIYLFFFLFDGLPVSWSIRCLVEIFKITILKWHFQ